MALDLWTTVTVWCDQFPRWSFDDTTAAGNKLLLFGIQYLLEYNMRFFTEIWCLSTWGHLKFAYEVLKWTIPKWITLNQNTWSQNKVCITKSSCDKCALLRHYIVYSSNSLPMFHDNPLVPPSIDKKSKEIRAWPKLPDTHKTFFLTLYPSSNSFKQARCFIAKLALILFPGKGAPNLVYSLHWVILNHWAPQTQEIAIKCVQEQI